MHRSRLLLYADYMRGAIRTLICTLVLAGCGDDGNGLVDGVFTPAEWEDLQTFGPVGDPPPDTTNRYADNDAVAAFGQRLFHEKRYAGPLTVAGDLGNVGETGKVACATCHDPTAYFTDTRTENVTSLGAARTRRNAPSLVNIAFYEWGNWAGAHDNFWKQASNSPETADNTGGNRLAYAHVVYAHYRAEYDALFPIPLDPALDPAATDAARFPPNGKPKANAMAADGPWEMMAAADRDIINRIMSNCGKSMAAYERKLVSRNAPFDQYVAGDKSAISVAAKRGAKLFIGKAACNGCHIDETFTDQEFHNTGIMQTIDPLDDGRFFDLPRALTNTFNGAGMYSDDPAAGMAKLAGLTVTDEMKGQFRTKSLRHLTKTAPYFHNGSMATLEDVVRFYNAGGAESGFPGTKDPLLVPLNLSESEITDLVAFLETLTGEPVPEQYTVNTAAP